MPKEIVRNFIRTADPDGAAYDDLFQAEVHWSRSQYVQVATVKRTEDYATTDRGEGAYVDLDRAGINRLIRILRKARDQAYGADA